jgi:O-succinylbenzoate synthase
VVLGLVGAERGVPLRELLRADARNTVRVNALVAGDEDACYDQVVRLSGEGFRAFKLKVGRRRLDEEIRLVGGVRELVGEEATLRLDANRAWRLEEALVFGRAVARSNIDYIEEPTADVRALRDHAARHGFPLPVALDESLRTLDPTELRELGAIGWAKAVILKPTLLGLERTLSLAEEARRSGLRAVLTSSFESSVGLGILAEVAASLNGDDDVPMGLGTASWLADDLTEEPLAPVGGRIDLLRWHRSASPILSRLRQVGRE